MSSIITFGYVGAPQGSPGAHPIAYCLLDDGEIWNSSDPNWGTPLLVADRSGNYSQGPFPGLVGYFAASPGTPMIACLGVRYWPVRPTPQGYHRDSTGLPYFYDPGACIRVSAAEVACLKHAKALATW